MSRIGAMRTLLVLAGCVSAATAVSAKDIYVATGGDDANAGTQQQPLKSLHKALDQAQAGDVVRIGAGEYRPPSITLKRSGTADKPLTIEAQPGEQVVIKGSEIVSGWKQHAPGVWKVENWKTNSQQLFVDGRPLQQIGVQTRWHTEKLWANHVCLPPVGKGLDDLKDDSFFYDQANQTLYCRLAAGADPNTHVMEASVQPFLLASGGQSHVVLRNLSFMHCNMTAGQLRNGMVQVGGTGWLVENCTFAYSDFAGLGLSGDNHVIRKCQFLKNGSLGIDSNGSDEAHGYRWYNDRKPMNTIIEDSEFIENNYRQFFDQWHAGAMKLVPAVRGITIRGNRIIDNKGAGIWFDGCLGSIRVENNLILNNMTGIFYEISGPAEGDEFGAIIRNNRVINGSRQGIYISASRGATVENNTCYNNRWDIVVHGMPRKEFGGQKLANNTIRNNIVSTGTIGVVLFAGEDSANNSLDGNFYAVLPGQTNKLTPVSVTKSGYDAGVCKDLAEASAKHGVEQHGKMGDPLWVDLTANDFRLKPGSPAQGKGWQP